MFVTLVFVTEYILILDKDNPSKYKVIFLNLKLSQFNCSYLKKLLPLNLITGCFTFGRKKLKQVLCSNWQWVFHIAAEEFRLTPLYRII